MVTAMKVAFFPAFKLYTAASPPIVTPPPTYYEKRTSPFPDIKFALLVILQENVTNTNGMIGIFIGRRLFLL